MMRNSVSIIIPTCNRKALLEENLKAIARQRFNGHLEIIVIDDCSTDGTVQMLKNAAARNNKFTLRYFKTSKRGPANARNLGIRHSNGAILIFLDDDSIIQNEDYVEEMVKSFEKRDVGIVGGKTVDVHTGIYRLIRAGNPPEIDFENTSRLKNTKSVPTKNAAFLKEAVVRAGMFNPIFKYAMGEDTDLCIRVLRLNYKLAFNKNALVFHYPVYSFFGYVKKSYLNGFSYGIFASLYPGRNSKFSFFKFIAFPIFALRNFLIKVKICFVQNLFSKSIFKELIGMYLWINASYFALHIGKMKYIVKITKTATALRVKIARDISKHFVDLVKYQIKKLFFPKKRSFITYLTGRCNQKCRHCFFSRENGKKKEEFSLEEIEKIARNYYINTGTHKFLARGISQGFTGGEPFLRDDLPEIVAVFRKRGIRHFHINTNGILTEKILSFCIDLLRQKISFKIAVSLDGLEETHDKIRNMPGAFRKSIYTIKSLKSIGAGVGVIITINRLNYKELKELMKFINYDLGIEPGVQLIRGASQANMPLEFKENNDPIDAQIMITKEIIPEIRAILYQTYAEKAIQDPFKIADFAKKFTSLDFHLSILEKGKRIFDCRAGDSVGVIYQNGDVALCEMYKPIGNLKDVDYDLRRLWNNPIAEKQRAFIKRCTCIHNCFINTEKNLLFTARFLSNIKKFSNQRRRCSE